MYLENDSMGSAALLWRHAKYNVNPKLGLFTFDFLAPYRKQNDLTY